MTPRSGKKAELNVLGDVGFWLLVCGDAGHLGSWTLRALP